MVGTKIDRLDVAPRPEIPEVDAMAVLVCEQVLGHDSILELRRQPPLARHHVIAWQVPPEIVVQGLGSAINLPASEDVKVLAVHDEDARRSIGAGLTAAPERADVDPVRTAMDSVRPRVAGLLEYLLRLDHLVNLWLGGIGFCVDDIDTRGAQPRDDQVAPLEECVAGEWR